MERSCRFYTDVLGGKTIRSGEPAYVVLGNSWIIINVGGGPTDDKPDVMLETRHWRPASFFSMKFFWEVFVTLFVVIDPPGTVPIFLGLTSGRTTKERNRLAWQAALVAFGVIVVFALFGQLILAYLGVQLAALEGAGGLLLLLVALQLLTGTAQEPTEAERQMANVAFVPLGTPLLAGPGAIVATMLFVKRINGAADAIAFSAALVAVGVMLWLFLRYSNLVVRVLRPSGVELLTRVSGLLVSAIAVQLIAGSVEAFVRGAH